MIFKAINTTINTNRSKLIMNYRHNCHKIRSIFNFIVSTISIINTKTKTFYVNVTLITRFHKRRNSKITYFYVFLKFLFIFEHDFYRYAKFKTSQHVNYMFSCIFVFLFIIEQKFHYNANFERFQHENYMFLYIKITCFYIFDNKIRKFMISNVKMLTRVNLYIYILIISFFLFFVILLSTRYNH